MVTENKGITALQLAIERQKLELTNKMLELGADPNQCDYSGENPIIFNTSSIDLLI